MKEANSILKMSYSFALDAASAAISMCQRQEYDLACQFWRASTSIYANVEEARASQQTIMAEYPVAVQDRTQKAP